jgi:surfactin synthase thioesterase subunit
MTADTAAADTWLRTYHRRPGATDRLVCFPHAGGSASFYHPVSAAMPESVEVLAVQYPGRQDRLREPAFTSVGALVDALLPILRDALDDRPTAFFGHSMGAIVAYETALRLQAEGRGPVRLFASGRRSPTSHRDEAVHLRDDDGMITELKAMAGTEAWVFGDEELMRMVLPALRADYEAIETYRGATDDRLACPLTVLVGDDDPKTSLDEAAAWADHAGEGHELQVYSGGHFYLSHHQPEILALLAERAASGA